MAAIRRGVTTIRFWVTLSFCAVILLVAYYVASDRLTPMTRDAYVQAYVIPVTPLVSGEVIEVLVENGAEVRKGDPLFRIDPRPFQFEVDRLKARLDELQPNHERQGEISEADPANVRQLRALLSTARLRLTQTTVLAPGDGFVDNLQLREGSYAMLGKAVITLVDARNWWIVANFEENALSVLQPGQRVEFGLYMNPGQVYSGLVESVGWGVDKGQGIASGNLPQVDNPARWVSFSQRFQIRITPTGPIAKRPLRVGATARVVVFAEDRGVMNALARSLMRVSATTDYLY